jgi:hypothetical protein
MPDDDKAIRLAELEVKRNRTLADLDSVQELRRSIRRSMESYLTRHDTLMQQYANQLAEEGRNEERLESLANEWNEVLSTSTSDFGKMVAEWGRVQLQEQILVKMMRNIDREIEVLKVALKEPQK